MKVPEIQFTTEVDVSAHTHVIDVRSPVEFAEDHVVGAINLPVLNDEERERVGTMYKQMSAFKARKLGAALISRNVAAMLEGPLVDFDGSFHPLVYCWRGGLRSQSLATIFNKVGWRVSLLEGGYKRYRRQVMETLDGVAPKLDCRVLTGLTGMGKTRILQRMQERGFQVVDLEGLARHKGSLLGDALDETQPTQKWFESQLAHELSGFDCERPVWLEAESNSIGELHIPSALWKQMGIAKVVEIKAPVPSRVSYLLDDYDYFCERQAFLKERLGYLKRLRGGATVSRWFELIDAGEWEGFVEALLVEHYDLSYARSMEKNDGRVVGSYHLEHLDDAHMDTFIGQLESEAGSN